MTETTARSQAQQKMIDPPPSSPSPSTRAKSLGKKVLSTPLFKPLWFLLGGLGYIVLRLLETWRSIEVDMLEFDRIGHFVTNTEKYLRELALDPNRSRRLPIFVSGPPANRQAFDMISRKVRVLESAPARLYFMLGLKSWIAGTRFDAGIGKNFYKFKNGVYFEAFQKAPPQLSFLPEEKARGRALLEAIGVPENRPYFCFHTRDSAYLATNHAYATREQWAYHDFRNSDIANCLPAAEVLAEKGLAGLRMGQTVEKPLGTAEPLLIDYASSHRSDFGDIFVIAHAKFYIGNTAGLTTVAYSFNVPVAQANLVPIGWPAIGPRDLFIPKKYWDTGKQRLLTFPEIIALGADYWNEASEYEAAGIRVIENTAEEITDLALEMNARLDGVWRERPEDQDLQDRYRGLFPSGRTLTGYVSKIGAEFIRKNRQLLEI